MERSFEPPARFEQVEPERGGRTLCNRRHGGAVAGLHGVPVGKFTVNLV